MRSGSFQSGPPWSQSTSLFEHINVFTKQEASLSFSVQSFFGFFWVSLCRHYVDFPGGSDGKASAYNAGDLGLIPGLGRFSGEGNGNPLQYSCLENPWTEEPGGLQSMWLQGVGHD